MPALSILARGERLRERILADAADLRITGFQSPAEDEKEEGLSLDRLTGLGAPHIWGVRVLDDTLLGFGIFPGDSNPRPLPSERGQAVWWVSRLIGERRSEYGSNHSDY